MSATNASEGRRWRRAPHLRGLGPPEAPDTLISFSEESRYLASEADRYTWHEQNLLRHKLKRAVGMIFYDDARGWLYR